MYIVVALVPVSSFGAFAYFSLAYVFMVFTLPVGHSVAEVYSHAILIIVSWRTALTWPSGRSQVAEKFAWLVLCRFISSKNI